MFGFLSQAFVTLLVIIDPFAVVPTFMMLTRNDSSFNKSNVLRLKPLLFQQSFY